MSPLLVKMLKVHSARPVMYCFGLNTDRYVFIVYLLLHVFCFRMFEAFLHAGPQTVLQIFLLTYFGSDSDALLSKFSLRVFYNCCQTGNLKLVSSPYLLFASSDIHYHSCL